MIGLPSLPARTSLACVGAGQALGADQLARGRSFLAKPIMKAMCAWMSFCGQLRESGRAVAGRVHHQHVLHGVAPVPYRRPGMGRAFTGSRSRAAVLDIAATNFSDPTNGAEIYP